LVGIGALPPEHVRDPICGMDVDPLSPSGGWIENGTTMFFCSDGCRAAFESGALTRRRIG